MKQSINEVTIAGKLSELDFRHDVLNGKPYIAGNIIIEVPNLEDPTKLNLIPVNVFASEMTKAGKQNPAYKGLLDLEKNAMSIASNGRDSANNIKVNAGSISENSYFSQSGALITGYRINGSFFTTKNVAKDDASFKHEIVILNMVEEIDKEDNVTGRLIVKGAIIQYGDKVDILSYVIETPQGIAFANQSWVEGNTVLVAGNIRQIPITDTNVSSAEGGFGVLEESKTRMVRELIINFGTAAKDEDESFNKEAIAQGLIERKARLEANKAKQEAKAATSSSSSNAPANSGSKPAFDF